MSRRAKNAAVVSRVYQPTPSACESALQILLKRPVKKEAVSSNKSGPDDAMKGSIHDRAETSIP